MAHAPTRDEAIAKLSKACSKTISLKGPVTNLHFVNAIVTSEVFAQGVTLTTFIDTAFTYQACGIDVISPGAYSTIQDFPGRPRTGYGVPRSGPMDSISSRIANLLVGNDEHKELVEITLVGPELLFTAPAVIAVCGASVPVDVDHNEQPMWSSLVIQRGQTLKIGSVRDVGCRVYLAVRGGFPNVPEFLGSKSTTPSLKFGGYQGRPLLTGDFLELDERTSTWAAEAVNRTVPPAMRPDLGTSEVYVLQGPHDTSDIMTDPDREMLYGTDWKVGHNSSRTGVRLEGPTPQWARASGGEGGSHPSNYLE